MQNTFAAGATQSVVQCYQESRAAIYVEAQKKVGLAHVRVLILYLYMINFVAMLHAIGAKAYAGEHFRARNINFVDLRGTYPATILVRRDARCRRWCTANTVHLTSAEL